jgi:undecaprenyl-diphosphatase
MSVLQSVWIGFCQIFSAVFPGTSRSMSTIAAGQLAGMSRPSALEFSFFLSMPTMAAATVYELFKTLRAHAGETALGRMPADGHEWLVLIIGFVISFFVAWAVVAWFMNWVRQRGFTPFAIYRIILGIAVLMWVARSHGGLH